MTDDIVTRLRDYLAIVDHAFVLNELSEAADEIERLRRELAVMQRVAIINYMMGDIDQSDERHDERYEMALVTIGKMIDVVKVEYMSLEHDAQPIEWP